MNRQAQAAVLFLVGGAMLHAGTTDLYLRYVKAGLRPLLLAAGAVLIATAAATVWYELRRSRAARQSPEGDEPHEEYGDGHGHGHDHGHREPRISWLLVLPLFALILVAPPALGSYSALRTGTAVQPPLAYTALPAGDPVEIGLVDYASRAAYGHGRTLKGRKVEITGFVALDRGGTPYLVRMALNCCAADAQPVKIGLSGKLPPVLRPDAWLKITGTYTGKRTKDPVNGGIIPFIDVIEARPVPTPKDPYDESWNQ
ncbi:TIGR03943 family putative permease subunit [Streptomyces yaanensis]|uniref:TIGR03943 family putative permease subunit n=1 Tax=Streptomyces yaanensis TaxID=1142239 RepID=A0ABV7SEK6_9ACTN|nr:TIGR03943 family protein [Streptomyces sp. CGMCC 4.7035]WNB99033.1 TIGR03943 family protein [Streptomyces sp. CGMCC 4.7035]